MTSARTDYATATREFDRAHENDLVEAILKAIIDTSMLTDVDCAVIRTGELASALLSCLAATLAMSPAATRSPRQIRLTVDELGKRLRRRIAAAEANPDMHEFLRRSFRGTDVGGSG